MAAEKLSEREVRITWDLASNMLKDLLNALAALKVGMVTQDYVLGIYDHWILRVAEAYKDLDDDYEMYTVEEDKQGEVN